MPHHAHPLMTRVHAQRSFSFQVSITDLMEGDLFSIVNNERFNRLFFSKIKIKKIKLWYKIIVTTKSLGV